jgi:hypothetical protein
MSGLVVRLSENLKQWQTKRAGESPRPCSVRPFSPAYQTRLSFSIGKPIWCQTG